MEFPHMFFSLVCVLAFMFEAGFTAENIGYTTAKCRPKEVHIAYGDSTSEMVILWSTEALCSPSNVQYSLGDIWGFDESAAGDSRVFEGLNGEKNYLHRVHMRNLKPDSTYFYKPSSFHVTSGPYFFKTPPADGADVHFLVVSDVSSTSPAIRALIDEANSGKYAAILHPGNIAMNLSSRNGEIGDEYFRLMEPAVRTVPYLVAPGPAEQEHGTYMHYQQRFSMPFSEWPINKDRMWYSVDVGNVHLISYSTEVFFTNNGELKALQHDWLLRDIKIANKNRAKVPWVVAFGHRPMYCSYEDPSLQCNQKMSKIKAGLEDILYTYGADIVIQSYGTAYERSLPQFKGVSVNDNYTDPLGPVHIMTGGASPWERKYNFTEPKPKWCAFRYTNHSAMSYGRLRVINASHAEYEQVDVETQEVMDSFTIVQSKHGQFSIEDLPANVTANIDQNIKDAGGKPGVLNIDEYGDAKKKNQSRIQELLHGDNRNRLIIGVVGAVVALVAIVAAIALRRCRKRRRTSRRWEQMDINYGKKFYSKMPDKEEDNDFEIDMSDGTEGTRQLLTNDD